MLFWRLFRCYVWHTPFLDISILRRDRLYRVCKSIKFICSSTCTLYFLLFNVLEDAGFYWVHRLLHHPKLYGPIHSVHHEFTETFSLNASISHPLEMIFNILLPLMAGPFIVGYFYGLHISMIWIWIAFREMRGCDAHSGYDLPFHPLRLVPGYGGPKFHDFHHSIHGRNSNFGGYKFWDSLCGTTKEYEHYYSN